MFPKTLAALLYAASIVLIAACSPIIGEQPEVPATAASGPNGTDSQSASLPPPPSLLANIVELSDLKLDNVEIYRERQTVANCGGTDAAKYTISRSREVQRIVEVEGAVSISEEGEVTVGIPEIGAVRYQLGTQVAAVLGVKYGETDTLMRSIEIQVKPKTRVEYIVSLQDVYQVGTATIAVAGIRYEQPFRFYDGFVMVLTETHELLCSDNMQPPAEGGGATGTPSATSTPTTSTTTATPTETETATPPSSGESPKNTHTPTSTLTPAGASTPTATTRASTSTPTQGTDGASHLNTSTPVPSSTPTPSAVSQGTVQQPRLLSPSHGTRHFYSRITFQWRWPGTLPPNWGFEIRAWHTGEPHNALVDARTTAGIQPDAQGIYSLDVLLPQRFSQSDWNWTVIVAQLDPFMPMSPEPPAFRISVDTSTPTPTLTPTFTLTPRPSLAPTELPTEQLTEEPTEQPTESPTESPTERPTDEPTPEPPTEPPTEQPTEPSVEQPTDEPTTQPADESENQTIDAPVEQTTDEPVP